MSSKSSQPMHETHPARAERGLTLIEILIAVVILSIGLLGLASLQSTGLRFNQSAAMRSQATILAYDMSDRMRANIDGVEAGDYLADSEAVPSAVGSCHTTGGCTVAEMAADDIATWDAAAQRYLPGVEWIICRDADPNDGTSLGDNECDGLATSPMAIKIWWDDNRDNVVDPDPFAVAFQP